METGAKKAQMEGILVSPLASPKGVKYECEMCGKIASIKCKHCGVTFYCSPEHQRIDWDGIHHKICPVLNQIRSPAVLSSERERAKREHMKEKTMLSIIEISKSEAMRNLVSNHFELAMAGALQAQRHSMEIFGANRVELVPAYLLLAEASMGLEHHRQAEGYLSKAKYNVLKHPDCPNILRSRLHRFVTRVCLLRLAVGLGTFIPSFSPPPAASHLIDPSRFYPSVYDRAVPAGGFIW
ncbi:putative MYND finger family protein [Paratrimastix pyriformis]|uniref:MYND finger family protein n=1 Tax=Paratrimastix pyriformis TaxID=342808 RepID=A0ABQ8UJ08_9EUKA|nr:putative MYND finger family protein [Paratrimastix pyriformis]